MGTLTTCTASRARSAEHPESARGDLARRCSSASLLTVQYVSDEGPVLELPWTSPARAPAASVLGLAYVLVVFIPSGLRPFRTPIACLFLLLLPIDALPFQRGAAAAACSLPSSSYPVVSSSLYARPPPFLTLFAGLWTLPWYPLWLLLLSPPSRLDEDALPGARHGCRSWFPGSMVGSDEVGQQGTCDGLHQAGSWLRMLRMLLRWSSGRVRVERRQRGERPTGAYRGRKQRKGKRQKAGGNETATVLGFRLQRQPWLPDSGYRFPSNLSATLLVRK